MRRHLPRVLLLALLALAAQPAMVPAAHAAVYKGRFEFTTASVTPVSETILIVRGHLAGHETIVGKFTGEVEYRVNLATYQFGGTLAKTAANGDVLHESLVGQFTPTGSVGTFKITSGTGRFRGATGDGSFEGLWTNPELTTAHITFEGTLTPGRTNTQVTPFQINGRGIVDFIPLAEGLASPHDADGFATLLGRYHAEGLVRLDRFTSPTTAEFSSAEPVVFTGANGDELHCDYAGTVRLIPLGGTRFMSIWVAEFTPAPGGTGSFANVIGGGFTMTAITAPFTLGDTNIAYRWDGAGTLEFRRGR